MATTRSRSGKTTNARAGGPRALIGNGAGTSYAKRARDVRSHAQTRTESGGGDR